MEDFVKVVPVKDRPTRRDPRKARSFSAVYPSFYGSGTRPIEYSCTFDTCCTYDSCKNKFCPFV